MLKGTKQEALLRICLVFFIAALLKNIACYLQEAIDRLVRDRTTIVIAHRLSTIQNVDRIYLLEAGEVVQVGTHDELLATGGRYKELYSMQFQRG